jgi:hypothetical protein
MTMNTNREERLRREAAAAEANLARARSQPAQRSGPPAPGDLYALAEDETAALEWLAVYPHPDDSSLLLIVPADDFPLVGTPDVALSGDPARRHLTARCGQGLWVPAGLLEPHRRVGFLPDQGLRPVRQKLADLARGRLAGNEEQQQVDADPEYAEWLTLLEKIRELLRAKSSIQPPPPPSEWPEEEIFPPGTATSTPTHGRRRQPSEWPEEPIFPPGTATSTPTRGRRRQPSEWPEPSFPRPRPLSALLGVCFRPWAAAAVPPFATAAKADDGAEDPLERVRAELAAASAPVEGENMLAVGFDILMSQERRPTGLQLRLRGPQELRRRYVRASLLLPGRSQAASVELTAGRGALPLGGQDLPQLVSSRVGWKLSLADAAGRECLVRLE